MQNKLSTEGRGRTPSCKDNIDFILKIHIIMDYLASRRRWRTSIDRFSIAAKLNRPALVYIGCLVSL